MKGIVNKFAVLVVRLVSVLVYFLGVRTSKGKKNVTLLRSLCRPFVCLSVFPGSLPIFYTMACGFL